MVARLTTDVYQRDNLLAASLRTLIGEKQNWPDTNKLCSCHLIMQNKYLPKRGERIFYSQVFELRDGKTEINELIAWGVFILFV